MQITAQPQPAASRSMAHTAIGAVSPVAAALVLWVLDLDELPLPLWEPLPLLPAAFDSRLKDRVAEAVAEAARKSGVARI